MDDKIKLGKKLRHYRELNKMTQIDLGKKLFVNRQTISTYETGKRIPCIFTLWKIADILGISVDELIGRK